MPTPLRPSFSHRWTVFYGAVLALVAFAAVFVRVNRTSSVHEGVYFQVPEWMAWREPSAGDLVTACAPPGEPARLALARDYLPPSEACPSGALPLLKRVVATAGQTVVVSPRGVLVDGRTAGPPPPTVDRGGRPLQPAYGTWRLGPGGLWLGSDILNGYDSRYFGPFAPGLRQGRAWLVVPLDWWSGPAGSGGDAEPRTGYVSERPPGEYG